jgi:hypothetical protein
LVVLLGFYEGDLVVLPVSSGVQVVRGVPALVEGEALALGLVSGAVLDGYVECRDGECIPAHQLD